MNQERKHRLTLKRHTYQLWAYCGHGDYILQGTGVPSRVTCKLCLRALKAGGVLA